MIVHLNGWPGVGKLTIGRELATRLNARLIDNHLLHDVALACTHFSDPDRWPLYEVVRHAAYAALLKRPTSEIFVMTNAFCVASERELIGWQHVVDLAVARNCSLIPVVLTAETEENVRRLESVSRSNRKLKDSDTFRSFIAADVIQRPDVPELIELDVTNMSAENAAGALRERIVDLVVQGLAKATDAHRRLR
ncbi:hypothetical protein LH128_06492 [Sphingomonas sp. LH128]|uniref:AAA family ATPase n=1 Tax=Sphingomonas sp. LH128 TaxID=473781 RepID=UPI00027CB4EE|nr:AAA family ATPase [Sphingomonas sp. LH128]EJU13872.1 hypothetical protein LH128_06492 [Sphingomonas sp. LH128]